MGLQPSRAPLSPLEFWPRGQEGVWLSLVSLPSHHMSLPWASPAFLKAGPSQPGSVPTWLVALPGAEQLAEGIQLPVLHAQGEPLAARLPKVESCYPQPPPASCPQLPSILPLPPSRGQGELPVTRLQDQTRAPCPLQLSSPPVVPLLFRLPVSPSLPVTSRPSLAATASLCKFFLPLWVWHKCHLHLVSSLH